MPIPDLFKGRLAVPAISAPMFLVSGPQLIGACCKAGVAAAFPALNARPPEVLDEWLTQIEADLGAFMAASPAAPCAPYGVNLILHHSNPRKDHDLERVIRHRVPFVITSLGNPREVAAAVHAYGGVVFSDVIHARHARKAIEAGADGIICVASGAGGHAGTQSAFSLVREIREFWSGTLILGGAISDGFGIRAAEALGADLAYLGTRFIATRESMAQDGFKQMIVGSSAEDIVYTDAVSGTLGNFLWPSLERAGVTREQLRQGGTKMGDFREEARAWRDVWSAGQGVAVIHDVPTVAELVGRLEQEYRAACALPPSPACRPG